MNNDVNTKSLIFGERVRLRRTQLNWTLKEFSETMGMTAGAASYLGQIETGKNNPTLSKALEIAATLGVSLSWLIGEATDAKADENLINQYKNDGFYNLFLTNYTFPNGLTYPQMEEKLKKLENLEKIMKG